MHSPRQPLVSTCAQGGLPIDQTEKAETLAIFTPSITCQRPYMRGFHGAWMGFFIAFLGWFAYAPLMTTIRDHVDITKGDIGTAGIASVGTTIFTRFAVGPAIDKWGPRRCMAGLLFYGAPFVAGAGLFTNGPGTLIFFRAAIGAAGATFVPCQAWTSLLFAPRIVGTANAFSAGWGNLGGGVTQLFMPAMMAMMAAFGANDEWAWRLAFLVPSVVFVALGFHIWVNCDDCPQGKFEIPENKERILAARAKLADIETGPSLWTNHNVWLLHIQYGCCFGVELVVNNVMSIYLYDYFCVDGTEESMCANKFIGEKPAVSFSNTTNADGSITEWCKMDKDSECAGDRALSKAMASTIASLFGLANLFARGLGGITSDALFRRMGFRGRMWAQMICLFGVGGFCMIFSTVKNNVPVAILVLVCFSMFVQATEGTSYGMVPFLKPSQVGVAAGIVGAGGNVGAVCWSTMFKSIDHWPDVFFLIGLIAALSGLLSFIMEIHGARITPGFSKDDHLGDARSAAGGNAGPPSLTQHSGATPTNGAQAGDIEAVKPADIGVGVASA